MHERTREAGVGLQGRTHQTRRKTIQHSLANPIPPPLDPLAHLKCLTVVFLHFRTADGDEVLVHGVARGAGRLPHKLNFHLLPSQGVRYLGDVLRWKGSGAWGYSVWEKGRGWGEDHIMLQGTLADL